MTVHLAVDARTAVCGADPESEDGWLNGHPRKVTCLRCKSVHVDILQAIKRLHEDTGDVPPHSETVVNVDDLRYALMWAERP